MNEHLIPPVTSSTPPPPPPPPGGRPARLTVEQQLRDRAVGHAAGIIGRIAAGTASRTFLNTDISITTAVLKLAEGFEPYIRGGRLSDARDVDAVKRVVPADALAELGKTPTEDERRGWLEDVATDQPTRDAAGRRRAAGRVLGVVLASIPYEAYELIDADAVEVALAEAAASVYEPVIATPDPAVDRLATELAEERTLHQQTIGLVRLLHAVYTALNHACRCDPTPEQVKEGYKTLVLVESWQEIEAACVAVDAVGPQLHALLAEATTEAPDA